MIVRGRVWKPRKGGFWHWQLIIHEAHRHARVYSGHEPQWRVALEEMKMQYLLHSVQSKGQTPFIVLGVDNPKIA